MIYLIQPSFSTLTEFTTCLDLQFLTVFQEEVTFIYRVSQPKKRGIRVYRLVCDRIFKIKTITQFCIEC